ncbi:HPHL1 protein, partial [Amia calva]|nr:HPHL1 protein [Amia calva]
SLCCVCALFPAHEGATRPYYIGIREATWDYAPSGQNLITGQDVGEDEHASVFLQRSQRTIGSQYKKALYHEYTNGSYTEEIPKPSWLGSLGPILKAEVEDVIVVHLKNFATRPYSIHPHGVFYDKYSEGALYPDGTSGNQKWDDAVNPGENYTYTWVVKPEYAPTEGDANCLTWVYHSHVHAPRDINSGLIGSMLTCKKGTFLENTTVRTDVDQDFVAMFSVIDENLSWYLQDNIKTYCTDPSAVDIQDKTFEESNYKHAINGYLFGNLPGITMCVNSRVNWHLFGMGNEIDIHSAHFYGNTVVDRGHRSDVISLFPASFATLEINPRNVGKWMLSCQVNDHMQAGMQAFYEVASCGKDGPTASPSGKTRHYYIAAEEIMWSYAPSGVKAFNGVPPSSYVFLLCGFVSLCSHSMPRGHYLKAHYVEYTDQTFTTKKQTEMHLGILGPVIKAEVDDTIIVTFMNKAMRNYSIQPHGLPYKKEYEGVSYNDGKKFYLQSCVAIKVEYQPQTFCIEKRGSHVQPNEVFSYRWTVTDGPSPSDPACISYLYYSASDPIRDTNSGLCGPLLLCKKGTLNNKGLQKGVDKEFFLLFAVFDENLSWYMDNNMLMSGTGSPDTMNDGIEMPNAMSNDMYMHAVNGYMYGNLPGLEMCEGDTVSWHMLGLGSEMDVHGVYFQGNTFRRDGTTRDTLSLFPHTAATVTMQPDSAGTFEVSCMTTMHYQGGMRQLYTVKKCIGSPPSSPSSTTTTSVAIYYIAAEEVEWDYSPDRVWELEKHNTTEEKSYGQVFLGKGEDRIGPKYKKVVYREYTDSHFTERNMRSPREEHLEILGPIIRAEVGENILIHFMNKASRPYSIRAHGVEVPAQVPVTEPGQMMLYLWKVPNRSGPGKSDPDCIPFVYHSSADFVKDTFSGLIGPLIICRRGILNSKRQRVDIDREFSLLFLVFDENQSWYLDDNIKTYLPMNMEMNHAEMDEDFMESNKMHAINGKMFGNLHGLTMIEGEKTAWYLLGMGNEMDIHTVHLHGETFIYKTDRSHRADVYDVFPGTFQAVELTAENPGTWLLHCHIDDHIRSGMETTYTIKART